MTGIGHIHHPALPVQHHRLPLGIQIQFIQGHISSSCSWTPPPIMLTCLSACLSLLLPHTSVTITMKCIKEKKKKNTRGVWKPFSGFPAAILCWDGPDVRYLPLIHSQMFLMAHVCKLPFASRWSTPVPTDNFQYLHFSVASKGSSGFSGEWALAPCPSEERSLSSPKYGGCCLTLRSRGERSGGAGGGQSLPSPFTELQGLQPGQTSPC